MDIRFACSVCDQHIAIDEAGAGVQIQCPNCQSQIIVPDPPAAPPRSRIRLASSEPGAAASSVAAPSVASPQSVVAPPPPPLGAVSGEQYRCNNPGCGAVLFESQLLGLGFGGQSIQ